MIRFAALSLLAIPLLFAGCDDDHYGYNQPRQMGAPPIYGNPGYGYDQAREIGHRDGMEAGMRDSADRRSPDPQRHGEFRRPPVDGRVRDEYRAAYQDGYEDAYRRRGGYSAPPPGYGRDDDDRRDDDRR